MGRSMSFGFQRTVAVLALAVGLVGCGPAGTGSIEPAASKAASSATADTTFSPSTAPTPAGATPVVAPDMTPEPALTTVWEGAGPAKARPWIWTPAVDPGGRIWAASSFDDVFWIFDPNGEYIESWGEPGNGDGEFLFAAEGNGYGAIAFRSDGGFYVADTGNSRVQQFDNDRKFIGTWGSFGTEDGQFTYPHGIETDDAGNVYVFDDGRRDIQQFDAEGTYVRTVAEAVGPYMGVAADGSVVAFDEASHSLVRYEPDGDRTLAVDLRKVASFVTDIAVRPSGGFLVASSTGGGSDVDYEHLIELDRDGTLLHVWPNGAEGIALAPSDDTLYLTFSDRTPVVRAVALP